MDAFVFFLQWSLGHYNWSANIVFNSWYRLIEAQPMLPLWRACNLTSISPCLTGPVDYPFASRHKGPGFKSPGGYLCQTGIPLLALSCYIGDPDVIDHYGLVWGGPRPEPSLGPFADNVIISLDLTQLSCPGFTLAVGLPSSFTIDGVSCWGGGGALWRACNLTSFSPCLTGPVDYPFALLPVTRGLDSNPLGGYLCETGIPLLALSRYTIQITFWEPNSVCAQGLAVGKVANREQVYIVLNKPELNCNSFLDSSHSVDGRSSYADNKAKILFRRNLKHKQGKGTFGWCDLNSPAGFAFLSMWLFFFHYISDTRVANLEAFSIWVARIGWKC